MEFAFYKYEVCGNDFIVIDNLKTKKDNNYKLFSLKKNTDISVTIERICDRNFGIGADGLIIINKSLKYNFSMNYYNSNGKVSTLCGNGARACVHLYHELTRSKEVKFLSIAGSHYGRIDNKNKVYVQLNDILLKSILKEGDDYIIDTGSPHYVKFIIFPLC